MVYWQRIERSYALAAEYLRGRSVSQDTTLKGDNASEMLRGDIDLMQGTKHGNALITQLHQDVSQPVSGPWIYAGEGLIQHDDVGVLDQGSGEQHPLSLATGEFPDSAMSESFHAEKSKAVARRCTVSTTRSGKGGPVPLPATHDNVLNRQWKIPTSQCALSDVGHTRGPSDSKGSPVNEHVSRGGHKTGHGAQQRGFACTVGTHERDRFTPENVEAHMVNCNDLSEAHAQVPHLDRGRHVTSLHVQGRNDREAATTAS